MAVQIEGLPEGMEALRVGKALCGEYVFHEGGAYGPVFENSTIYGLVLAPAPGYEFVYDVATDHNLAIKKLDTPKTLHATFLVTNTRDEQAVRQHVLKLPGFQQTLEG